MLGGEVGEGILNREGGSQERATVFVLRQQCGAGGKVPYTVFAKEKDGWKSGKWAICPLAISEKTSGEEIFAPITEGKERKQGTG